MWRKSPKQAAGAPKDTLDIETLLQCPMGHKSAAEPDLETGFNSSAQSPQDQGEHQRPQLSHLPQVEGEDLALATKCDITQLMQEIKQMYDTNLNLARLEMQAVTTRVQATEEDIMDLRQEVHSMGDALRNLQSANIAVPNKLDTIDDRSRQKKKQNPGDPQNYWFDQTTTLPKKTYGCAPSTHKSKGWNLMDNSGLTRHPLQPLRTS
ncbi:Hypothetical predicted protein [Pelobates cultripes]|uniref:Uncharacterized protein n=1 Tax=Pelobates cultripes TaxID=61616 RepID=A0AAD1TFM9_PELCU|nr:Hypothetical predicted protein [Pelobates cultripes]